MDKMKLGTEVGLDLGEIVLDGNPAPSRGAQHPQFWPIYRGKTAAWIKMALGTAVGLGPGYIALHCVTQLHPTKRSTAAPPPQFSAYFYCGQTVVCIKQRWNRVRIFDPTRSGG